MYMALEIVVVYNRMLIYSLALFLLKIVLVYRYIDDSCKTRFSNCYEHFHVINV